MWWIVASVVCSVTVSILLKFARGYGVSLNQAVAFNYISAGTSAFFLLDARLPAPQTLLARPWWLFLALGVLLPSVFVIMGRAVENAGIVRADAAQRLSLFLPVAAAFTLFGETLTFARLSGVVLAFLALFFLLFKEGKSAKQGGGIWLVAVWFGYGIIDILFKAVAKTGGQFADNLIAAFTLAGILIFLYIFLRREKITAAGVIGGLLLGMPNFFNILCYIKAHQFFARNATLVFVSVNIGVIVLATLIGAAVFREKISRLNAAGIALAVCAILVLGYGARLM